MFDEHEKPSRAWLQAFARGDRKLLERIYLQHARRVRMLLSRGFTFTKGGRPAGRFVGIRSAFDLDCGVHEVFRRAFELRTRQSYDGRVPFSSYLDAIARNYALNTLRCREEPFDLDEINSLQGEILLCDDASSPEHHVQQRQLRESIERFRQTCDDEERVVLACRYEEGISQAQTAERLGTTRRRIRTVEFRLRRKLVLLLRQHRHGTAQ